MIASVEGTVAALTADGVVVRVGGVGLALHTTAGTRARELVDILDLVARPRLIMAEPGRIHGG